MPAAASGSSLPVQGPLLKGSVGPTTADHTSTRGQRIHPVQ